MNESGVTQTVSVHLPKQDCDICVKAELGSHFIYLKTL